MKVFGFLASGWTLTSIMKPESQGSECLWALEGGAAPTREPFPVFTGSCARWEFHYETHIHV